MERQKEQFLKTFFAALIKTRLYAKKSSLHAVVEQQAPLIYLLHDNKRLAVGSFCDDFICDIQPHKMVKGMIDQL